MVEHLPALIEDLAMILCVAGFCTILFKRLRQPQVLGYLIAGFLAGPHFRLFPTVTDVESIKTWSDIGVIFLLFSLGLEFSFKKLAKVGSSAGITAVVEVLVMLLFGYITGRLLGWSQTDSLFLGGILSISSTTIILRAFEEAGVKKSSFASLVFGVLIVEDLVAILLLVLLSTLAAEETFSGMALVTSLIRLVLFILFWFLAGIFLIPTFFRVFRPWLNNESILVTSVALCMGLVILSVNFGFSASLGAFIMGSILAETQEARKIEHIIEPVRNLFGAIFFISVGMLIDLSVIREYLTPILIITGVTIVGKAFSSAAGALMSGKSLETSVLTGLSLAQIGEFSFIIAALGLELKVMSPFEFPIAVAVSTITTFTTPYLIRGGSGIYGRIARTLPKKWTFRMAKYETDCKSLPSEPAWKTWLKAYLLNLVINGVVLIGLLWLSIHILYPFIGKRTVLNPFTTALLASGATLVLMSPFLWALAFRKLDKGLLPKNGPIVLLEVLRLGFASAPLVLLLNQYFHFWAALGATAICCAAIYFVFASRLAHLYARMENSFLRNLRESDSQSNH